MGVPNSEVGYTSAMPGREDHEVHKDIWWHWKYIYIYIYIYICQIKLVPCTLTSVRLYHYRLVFHTKLYHINNGSTELLQSIHNIFT